MKKFALPILAALVVAGIAVAQFEPPLWQQLQGQPLQPSTVQTSFIDAGTEVISGAPLGAHGVALSLGQDRGIAFGNGAGGITPIGADCTNTSAWCVEYDGLGFKVYYGSQARLVVDQNTGTVSALVGYSAPLYTATGSGSTTVFQLYDQAKIAWAAGDYLTESTHVLSYVTNGATGFSDERTAGMTIFTPGVGASGRPPIILFSSATAVQNGGSCAGNVDLITYTLPASTLINTNQCILVEVNGTTANNATAKNVDLTVASTTLVTKSLTISIAGTWEIKAKLCRTGASAQTSWAVAENYGGTTVSSTDGATVRTNTSFSTPAITETSTALIRARCITNANAAGDIIAKDMTVTYL